MLKKGFIILIVVAVFSLTVTTVIARTTPKFTEFPIAVGRDSAFVGGAAFDGTNYLVGILGDTLGSSNITAQLVSQTGSLIGSRISVGRTGAASLDGGGPAVAFDGTNYLMVWTDNGLYPNLDIYGQFVAPSGNLVRTPFPIAETADDELCCRIAFADPTYMVVFVRNDILYGQCVDKSGNLVGSVIQISSEFSRWDFAIAFDGTNYLVVWVKKIEDRDKDIYGQFVSAFGLPVGTNFLIDDGTYPSDNPVSVAFDGSRYLVCFTDEVDTTSHYWDVFGRFVTTSGDTAERVTICEDTGEQIAPFIAFDGTNYLITLNDIGDTVYCKGRFFNTSGAPVDNVFTIFGPLGDKFPIGGVMGYDGSQYFVGCSRVTIDTTGGQFEFTNGDVYGTFISPYMGITEGDSHSSPITFELMENYPNPFTASTSIKYALPRSAHIELAIYNIQGQLVRTLFRGEKAPGTHIVSWNGRDEMDKDVSSGIYFCQLKEASGIKKVRKMLLLR